MSISNLTRLNACALAAVTLTVDEVSSVFSAGSPSFAGMPKGSRSTHGITASSVPLTGGARRIHHLSAIDTFVHDRLKVRAALAFFSVSGPLKTGAVQLHGKAGDQKRGRLRKMYM